ncbi:MAG TPA: hypothetical protein VFA06_14415 [Actinocrinis sp.]|uniref:hypothetical protein n=1 Tax=Actinocrinis sp. TaxID=1920516 RepID=UPI002D3A7151|nr:hypothetical protein [Actinocrinis sp.]HZU57062.1 hypothetical protein [Actinocrinis sp.]
MSTPTATTRLPASAALPPAADAVRVADVLLTAGRYAQKMIDEHPELSLRAAVHHAVNADGGPLRDPSSALDALADYLAPGWRANPYWTGPGEVVDRWQKQARRPLDVPGVLGLAAVHTASGGAP